MKPKTQRRLRLACQVLVWTLANVLAIWAWRLVMAD